MLQLETLSILRAVFLIVLSVCGNYVAETLGCQTQRLLRNMWAKQALILFIIYFTIDFTDSTTQNPFHNLGKAFIVWVAFNMFTRMNITPTLLVGGALMAMYFIANVQSYITDQGQEGDEDMRRAMAVTQTSLGAIAAVSVLVCSAIYYQEKRREHGGKFSHATYFMGVSKCRNG